MAESQTSPVAKLPPVRGTAALLEFFWAADCDLHLFTLVTDTMMRADYVAYIAQRALDGFDGGEDGHLQPIDLANRQPGPHVTALKQAGQELLTMFLTRAVDNFQIYLTQIIRAVLIKCPAILSARKQELSLGHILGFDSIASLVMDIVESKINSLSFEGFGTIEEWCKDRGIPLLVPEGERGRVIEIIALRNLIIHNRAVVDSKYLKAAQKTDQTVGSRRLLTGSEFFAALDLLRRIVLISDSAISGKFELPLVAIQDELKERSKSRLAASSTKTDPIPHSH